MTERRPVSLEELRALAALREVILRDDVMSLALRLIRAAAEAHNDGVSHEPAFQAVDDAVDVVTAEHGPRGGFVLALALAWVAGGRVHDLTNAAGVDLDAYMDACMLSEVARLDFPNGDDA
jgi:hypothetical protein